MFNLSYYALNILHILDYIAASVTAEIATTLTRPQLQPRPLFQSLTMFFIFDLYSLKGPIELDASFLRYFHDIRDSLIQSKTYEEIKAFRDRFDEVLSLDDP
jgi:hypothetical protein